MVKTAKCNLNKVQGVFLNAISKADKHFPKNDMLVIVRDDDMSQEQRDSLWGKLGRVIKGGHEIIMLEHGTPGHHRKVNFSRK